MCTFISILSQHYWVISILDKLWKLNTVCIENLVSLNSPELFMSIANVIFLLFSCSLLNGSEGNC